MNIVLLALKIILIVIISLVLLIVFLVCVVLFVPVKYSFSAEKDCGGPVISLKMSWLLGLLKINYSDKIFSYRFLMFSGPKEKKSRKASKRIRKKKKEIKEDKTADSAPKVKQVKEAEITAKKNKTKRKPIKEIYKEIKKYTQYPGKKEILRHILVLTGRWLKALKPKKNSFSLDIGLDDPASTGFLLGFLGILQGITGINLNVTGHFDETVFKYKVYLRDRLAVWSFTWPLISFVFKKPVRRIIWETLFGNTKKNKKADENGSIVKPKP